MSKTRVANCCARFVRTALALSATTTLLAAASMILAADESAKNGSADFIEKMKKWQTEMSEKFRDTYRSLRGNGAKQQSSSATASVDLREPNESYTLRLNLPERDLDKVEIRL